MGRKNKRAENLEKREQQRKQQLALNRKEKFFKNAKWALFIVAIGVAIYFLFTATSPPLGDFEPLSFTEIDETDHVIGNPDASILIIEYSNFQCPACAHYSPLVMNFMEEHGDSVAFVFRHFPLKQIHRNAEPAARAAEAAAEQGMFWEMKELLFAQQSQWSPAGNPRVLFEQYAEQLGLDVAEFSRAYNSREVAARVEHNYRHAVQSGLRGTPTFFINGQQTQFETIVAQFTP